MLIPGSKTHHHPFSFIRNLSIIFSPSFGSSELPNFPFFLKNLVYSFISCLNPAQLILGIIIDQLFWASPEVAGLCKIIIINIKRTLIAQSPPHSKRYLATVASVASLLTHRVCGCNEIYHLRYPYFYNCILA